MGEAESETDLSLVRSVPRRGRLVMQLTAEIDHLKREIERSRSMRNRSRILYEFERPSPFEYVEMKYINSPENKEVVGGVSEAGRIEMAANYILDAKTVGLIDVLRQSRKVVFSDEWRVGYEEGKVLDVFSKIGRERRKNRLVCVAREVSGIDWLEMRRSRSRMASEEIERKRMLESIKQELKYVFLRRVFCDHVGACDEKMCTDRVILPGGKDNPPAIFGVREPSTYEGGRTHAQGDILESFKKHLSNFSKCNSSMSSRSSFQTTFPSTGLHPTNQYIFKKIPAEYLRCKSAREIIDYKYRNVVVEKMRLRTEGTGPKRSFSPHDDDSFGDLCSSRTDENELEIGFLLNPGSDRTQERGRPEEGSKTAGGRVCVETSFDKFLNDRNKRGLGTGTSFMDRNLTDFMRTPQDRGLASSHRLTGGFYGDFPDRADGTTKANLDGGNGERMQKEGKGPKSKS